MKDKSDITEELFQLRKNCPNSSLGKRIQLSIDDIDPDLPTFYIETPLNHFMEVRRRLYLSSDHFANIQIVDLGLTKNEKIHSLIMQRCVDLPHHTLLSIEKDIYAAFDQVVGTYEKKSEPFNTMHITDGATPFLNHSKHIGNNSESMYAAGYSEMGWQIQKTPRSHLVEMEENHFEYHRLGAMRENKREWEPILRNQNICLFNANVLKKADFRSKFNNNPSGYTSEEALQILKYASISSHMSFIYLYQLDIPAKKDWGSYEWLSQAMWYAIHGADSRVYETPYHNPDLQEFIIDTSSVDQPLSFVKSNKTGRIWVKIKYANPTAGTYLYLPCSEKDFELCKKDYLPSRIVKALHRAID